MKLGMAALGVAPLVGAWIEIRKEPTEGLPILVAPLVGAWIEILAVMYMVDPASVAPLVGAWIEIRTLLLPLSCRMSLPLWERGLK